MGKSKKSKLKISFGIKRIFILFFSLVLIGVSIGTFVLYGPNDGFRNWLITTAMTTQSHQYLARWFYSEDLIQDVLANNYIIEIDEDTDLDLIDFEESVQYASKYEKEILERDKDALYKVIELEGKGYNGYLVAIYDPSKVKLGTTSHLGDYGESTMQISKNYNALVTINAGGFFDPDWNSNGGIPHGTVIQNSKIVWDYVDASVGGGIVGFTNDNKLVLGRWSAQNALKQNIRDAVEFGPFLIVNGKSSFVKGDGGWGTAPRTAIGQRADGIVLMVVINGRNYSKGILGIDMVGLTEIMENYGAVNAACMDGGTSSSLIIKGELINDSINSNGKHGVLRRIPTAWIVTE